MHEEAWTPDRLAAVRAGAQGLTADATDVVAAVTVCAGVQAQDTPASRLAVRARSNGLTASDVRQACNQDRTVVRTWAMRGTLHAVAAADVRWIVALTGPTTVAGYARRRAYLGLDDRVCAALLDTAPTVLASGPLTRAELITAWNEHGVPVATTGQAGAHAVLYAAACGLVCRGPDHADEPTYVLTEDWLPDQDSGQNGCGPDEEGKAIRLAHRYLNAFGPADVRDFRSWSGLPAAQAGRALDNAAHGSIRAGSRTLLIGERVAEPAAGWRLLPAFDTALLGHRDRPGSPDALALVLAGGGWIHPSVLHAGRVVGSWRWRPPRRDAPATVTAQLTTTPGRAARQELDAEVADVARFLGHDEAQLILSWPGHRAAPRALVEQCSAAAVHCSTRCGTPPVGHRLRPAPAVWRPGAGRARRRR